jgi:hypothetical protein
MAIKSVTLEALPKRSHAITDDERKTGAAIVKATEGGKYATDGESYTTRGEANAVASRMKRLLVALDSVPSGKVVTTATRPLGEGFGWYMTFADAPAEPRKRNRKAATTEEAPATA